MERDPAELIDQHVAARIRARRIDLGITLQALARQIGVAFQQAHKYERGLSRISAGRLFHVASALKAPVGFFFATTDPAAPEGNDDGSGTAGKTRSGSEAKHDNGIDSAA
jgi:transcriptional regulator with XRE-family HTH domain